MDSTRVGGSEISFFWVFRLKNSSPLFILHPSHQFIYHLFENWVITWFNIIVFLKSTRNGYDSKAFNYLPTGRLREVKNEKRNPIFSSKSGRGRLREVVLWRGFNDSDLTWKDLVFWKSGRLGEVVATGGSTLLLLLNSMANNKLHFRTLVSPVKLIDFEVWTIALSLVLYTYM